ncbi:uncharacterized protein LOC124818163 [Hydra vulgaris]|uniref:uncharacterized protein LOC124818163 n=1 Tax=Hydra vulgaris TaxID=6087 RepID=UPI0032EA09EE
MPNAIKFENKLITNSNEIAAEFNNFFSSIGHNLSNKIPYVDNNSVDEFISSPNSTINFSNLTYNEFEIAFKSLKRNKAIGPDDINGNIVIDSFNEIKDILFKVFKASITQGSFPNSLKIAKVTPIFKTGDHTNIKNYRPISVLPVFSKILERIMYNRIYTYLIDNKLLYKNQFGFQRNSSTEHAILQITRSIADSFKNSQFTLGIFIDLSKASDTVNHHILIKKLESYAKIHPVFKNGDCSSVCNYRPISLLPVFSKTFERVIINRNYDYMTLNTLLYKNQFGFQRYCSTELAIIELSNKIPYPLIKGNKKQFVVLEESGALDIVCGVPQEPILGPLLSLIYINDMNKASHKISSIMYADDTNLFYYNSDVKVLFETMNSEPESFNQWFIANKLSLNCEKTVYTLIHKIRQSTNLPLKLPKLSINKNEINRVNNSMFLGVIFDENLSWKKHISLIEGKISSAISGIEIEEDSSDEIENERNLFHDLF